MSPIYRASVCRTKTAAALDVGEHAQVVAALLDQLAVSPVGLLGCSFGAQVAAELAVRRPDLVAALMLVGPTTDRIAPEGWLAEAAALIPHARRVTIDGAAHNAVTTAGPRLGAAVESFMDGAVVSSGPARVRGAADLSRTGSRRPRRGGLSRS